MNNIELKKNNCLRIKMLTNNELRHIFKIYMISIILTLVFWLTGSILSKKLDANPIIIGIFLAIVAIFVMFT